MDEVLVTGERRAGSSDRKNGHDLWILERCGHLPKT